MRYIGNKTKLIPFLMDAVEEILPTPGVACDPFAGTASVSAALKAAGWQVHSGDLLASSYAFQVARVQLDAAPRFPASLLPDPSLPPGVSSTPSSPASPGSSLAPASGGNGTPSGEEIGYARLLRRLAKLVETEGGATAGYVANDGGGPGLGRASGAGHATDAGQGTDAGRGADAAGGNGRGAGGFIFRHYTAGGDNGENGDGHGRRYFLPENARRIDAVREWIDRWVSESRIGPAAAQLLIATLIEAADRVANTTGVYSSFVKTMQPNALRPFELRPLVPTPRKGESAPCSAFCGPAARRLATVGPIDLAYLDPPYNGRQYPAYYHIPELLARGWRTPPNLRGKTGLIPDHETRSDWCIKERAPDALHAVLDAADARHILLSYSDEGLLSRTTIEGALRDRGRPDSYQLMQRRYRRYRSDSDGPSRSYRRDDVREHLHYVRCA